MYIHEQGDWPKLQWNSEALTNLLAEVRHRQGRLLGQMQALGFGLQEEAVLRTLTEDVVKSSAIEGQELDPAAVRSSIARAIADLCLARSEKSPQRFYSMSAQIRQERKEYYDLLEHTQKGETDITEWLTWFLECLGRAIDGAETLLASVLTKARFWENIGASPLNDRQRLILNKLLDGFEGKLTSSKWAQLTKSSQDTAQRDITDLVQRRILVRSDEGGRSTSYTLAMARS